MQKAPNPIRITNFRQPGPGRSVICMYNAGGNDHRLPTGLAQGQSQTLPPTRGTVADVPQVQGKLAGTDESEVVGLMHMLVRTPRYARKRLAKVRHHREVVLCKLILAEYLQQPSTRVVICVQITNDQPVDWALGELVWLFPNYLIHMTAICTSFPFLVKQRLRL